MKVKLLVSRSCSVNGTPPVGTVIEVDDAEGGRMIAAGQAEAVEPPKARKPAQRAETRESKSPRESR